MRGNWNVGWKALYFFVESLQLIRMFTVPFYMMCGLTALQAGFIEAVFPFAGFLITPLVSFLADAFGLHKQALITCVMVYALAISSFLFITPHTESNFRFILIIRLVSSLGIAPCNSLLNGIVYQQLESAGATQDWGKQRLWGSIGFSLCFFVGTAAFPAHSLFAYFVVLTDVASGLFILVALVAMWNLRSHVSPGGAVSTLEAISSHLADGRFWLVVVVSLVGAVLTYFRDVFIVQYMLSIGGSSKLMGITQLVLCVVEVPTFFFAARLIRLLGVYKTFVLCLVTFAARFLALTLLTPATVWLVVLIEISNVVCFCILFTAVSQFVVDNFSAELTVTLQGVVAGLWFGLGAAAGSLLGGFLAARFSFVVMYRAGAGLASLSAVVVSIWALYLTRKTNHLNNNENEECVQSAQQDSLIPFKHDPSLHDSVS